MAWKTAHPDLVVLPTHADDYADVHQVAFALSVSRATIYREIVAGTFPDPVKIRGRSMWRWGWVLDYKRRKETQAREAHLAHAHAPKPEPKVKTPGGPGGWNR